MRRFIATGLPGITSLFWLVACAPVEPPQRPPGPDMVEVAKQLNCRAGLTATCEQRMNRPTSCYCADRDSLQMILEPDKY